MRRTKKQQTLMALMHAFLFSYIAFVAFPLILAVFTSLKSSTALFNNPLAPPAWGEIIWENYIKAWDQGIKNYLLNSIIVTFFSTLGVLLCGGLCAFSLARLKFSGRYLIYILLIIAYSVPMQAVLVPLYNMLGAFNLHNSLQGLIVAYIAFGIPFSVIVLFAFFADFPKEIEEAAYLDHCTPLKFFFYIALPIAKPAFFTVAIFQIVNSWNEFLIALLIQNDDKYKTIPLGLSSFQGQWGTAWELIMAAVAISIIPVLILYTMFQKHFINTLSGMSKG